MSNNDFSFGLGHTEFYKPSAVAELRFDRDGEKTEQIHSDVYFLLRQDSLQKKIGVETVRQYINSLVAKGEVSSIPRDLSDDELFDLIPSKELNNMTTAYQVARSLESSHKEVKARYEKLHSDTKRYSEWRKKYGFSSE